MLYKILPGYQMQLRSKLCVLNVSPPGFLSLVRGSFPLFTCSCVTRAGYVDMAAGGNKLSPGQLLPLGFIFRIIWLRHDRGGAN